MEGVPMDGVPMDGVPTDVPVVELVPGDEAESYRATVPACTPEATVGTLIVTRKGGLGRRGRVWLTLKASIRTTVVLTDDQVDELTLMLAAAAQARP
ncbi:MAG: hypothetical protein ACR2FQ_04130 [Pseudonocardiaceae bacterium]